MRAEPERDAEPEGNESDEASLDGPSLDGPERDGPERDEPQSASPRALRASWVALGLYLVVTVVYALTTAPERLRAHTPFNHFALLAEAWLDGRLDLGGPPPDYTQWNDFAVFRDRVFVSFPPFPAVLLVPLVWLAGSAEATKDGAFFVALAGFSPAVLFLALEKLVALARSRRSQLENAALSLFFALGSVLWFSSVQGTVWFAGHVVGTLLATGYLWASLGAEHPALAGLCVGLGFATRTPLGFAAPLFVYEALRASARGPVHGRGLAWLVRCVRHQRPVALAMRLALFAAPAVVVLGALLLHNRARFGDALEFGHAHLSIAWRPRIEKWGLFSYHYLGRNLGIVLASLPFRPPPGAASAGLAPFQINAHGLALWLTTPLYVYALWPRVARGTFVALALTAAAVAAPALLYQNSGWIQFGYRFSNDFAPFLFAMIAVSGRRFGPLFYALGALGVVINAFGAVSFQRPGWERYYYLDRTQKIVFQPD